MPTDCAAVLADRLNRAAAVARDTAADGDRTGAFPHDAFAALAEAGLLTAPLPTEHGGLGWATDPAAAPDVYDALRIIGRASLPVGRLYEGHIDGLRLVSTFGTAAQLAAAAADARAGRRFAVWNTEGAGGVTLEPQPGGGLRMRGAKTFASGAGIVERPIVTGRLPDGGWQMVVVPADAVALAVDPDSWRPLGMRATGSFRAQFDGVVLGADAVLGAPDAYYREPDLTVGVARFAAVQLGGAEALVDATAAHLRELNRTGDIHQQDRVGRMAIAVESGRLWLDGMAQRLTSDPTTRIGYANMVRTAIETICLDVIRLTEQAVGARGLVQPHPVERIVRDLTIYLRQPAPDAALSHVGSVALSHGLPSSWR